MKKSTRWYSQRLGEEISVVRWGVFGKPLILFPTAGGDAEEVERFHMLDVLEPLVADGRIKVYSCDSVAGRAMLQGKPADHCAWMMNQFQEFIRHEFVPAIRTDCESPDIEVMVSGSSIGAFTALSVLCRYPDIFSTAICMSGTYNMTRWIEGNVGDDLYYSSPLHFIPNIEGEQLEALRKRFVLLASGEGRAEDIGESWNVAGVLGSKGIPNRVDSWGPEWHHDWVTWRKMLPQYMEEYA